MRSLLFASLLVLCVPAASAGQPEDPNPAVLELWPAGAPGGGAPGPEVWTKPAEPGRVFGSNLTAVGHPTLTVFPAPAGRNTGVGIIVCPGGGFRELVMEKEGGRIADWLNSIGVTAFVLKYRVPDTDPAHLRPLQDAQRAIRLVRAGAARWGIRPDRVGMAGFSAGAALIGRASTRFGEQTYTPVDAADRVGCRPDFAILAYPGDFVDKERGGLRQDLHVTKDTPETFLVQAEGDRVNSENSVFYFLALKRAGVPAEIHIYARGEHGFALRPTADPIGTWSDRCVDWMVGQGILARRP